MQTLSRKTGPRRTRLQFSLRLLLVAVTAFAIGFPIWYRWPYEEVDAGGTRTTTWQRQWGGSRLQHGKRTLTQGKLVQISTYRRGQAHGPYLLKVGDQVEEVGQYVDGLKEGTWTCAGNTILHWHHGKLDGKCELKSRRGNSTIVTFAEGRLTHVNGRPVEDHLFGLLQSNVVDERIASELGRPTSVDVVEMPLKDTMLYLQEAHNTPFVIDQRQVPNGDLPLTAAYSGIGLGSVLTLFTAPHGLACDYRYGRLWITTASDAKDWRDPTGVAEIRPPAGTQLAVAWNEPAKAAVTTAPLAEVLATVAEPLGIKLDTSQVAPAPDRPNSYPTVSNTDGLPFRYALGILLCETGCRCKLDGETLVILPPDER
jgi:hypothetical protein